MQGTKLSNIKCSVQIDTLDKECYSSNEGMFLYKECVYVPPLSMIDDIASFSKCGPDSIKVNAVINSKIESKKLEFGPKKCYNIHIGKKNSDCLEQKVHQDTINDKSYETYLGDIVCSSGSNDRNIENRYNQGIGSVGQIMTILNQVSLGHYYVEIGLAMRDTILISKLVFNSEVWYNVKDKQISKLEQIDQMFFRKLLNLPRSAPREGMYIECGKLPVRFILKTRRLMFFWHVLNKDKHEILYKFLSAQQLSSSRTDWIRQVRKDMSEIKLEISDVEIENMSKEMFKKIVKQKIENCAVKYLQEIKNSHSKTSQLQITKFQSAEYLKSNQLNLEEVQTLYKLRNRVIDLKENFKSSYQKNMWCRTCFLFNESQSHLLQCPAIVKKLKNEIDFKSIQYSMLFSTIDDQVKIAKIYTVILKARLDLIEELRNE